MRLLLYQLNQTNPTKPKLWWVFGMQMEVHICAGCCDSCPQVRGKLASDAQTQCCCAIALPVEQREWVSLLRHGSVVPQYSWQLLLLLPHRDGFAGAAQDARLNMWGCVTLADGSQVSICYVNELCVLTHLCITANKIYSCSLFSIEFDHPISWCNKVLWTPFFC